MKQEDKFLSVLEANKGILYKVANIYCKDSEDRKDLLQEMIFQLWKSFDKYNSQFKHSTWMYRIALNVAISFYRKEINRQRIEMPIKEDIFNFGDHSENKEKEANFNLLEQFIASLKEMDKALILLYLEEKNHKEIAEIMGISESNVGTKISRIKSVLAQKFSNIKIH